MCLHSSLFVYPLFSLTNGGFRALQAYYVALLNWKQQNRHSTEQAKARDVSVFVKMQACCGVSLQRNVNGGEQLHVPGKGTGSNIWTSGWTKLSLNAWGLGLLVQQESNQGHPFRAQYINEIGGSLPPDFYCIHGTALNSTGICNNYHKYHHGGAYSLLWSTNPGFLQGRSKMRICHETMGAVGSQ